MRTKVLLVGCSGAMGGVVSQLVSFQDQFDIVAGIDWKLSAGTYPIYERFEEVTESIDVIIDFSSSEVLEELLEFSIARKTPVVLCTTGYDQKDHERIQAAARVIPVFRSENMSYGINVMVKLLKQATKLMSDQFDIEIIEKHHNQKKDAPSGTAELISREINACNNNQYFMQHGRKGNCTKRKSDEIGVHSIRGGTYYGEHTVIFAGNEEVLEIKHSAMSKKVFAEGALRAAAYIIQKNKGYFDMNNLIDEN